jgi:hypothetical protein
MLTVSACEQKNTHKSHNSVEHFWDFIATGIIDKEFGKLYSVFVIEK